MHVAIVGAGAAGLGTALAFARQGHQVTIIERDATPLPPDPVAAFDWDRRGAPQVRHSHAFLARLRNLLRDAYPDVHAALLAAGATEIVFCDNPPPELALEPEPGDDDLVALACRRTTFEWVLRRLVVAEPTATLIDGVATVGLLGDPVGPGDAGGDRRAVVRGVRLAAEGEAERELVADLVVAATGRRSPVPRWLGELGVTVDETEEDTGIVYLSRFYRLAPGADTPVQRGPIGGDLGYLKYAVFQGDNHTWSVTFAVRTHDDHLRRLLLDPEQFDRAARVLPATAPWVVDGVAEPITGVHVMGGLLNRIVRFTDEAGEPLVRGFVAVGDAHTCTNPLYGRGCSLGFVQGHLLADAVRHALGDDGPTAERLGHAARAYEAACTTEIEPWYRAAVAQDRMARAAGAAERDGPAGARPADAGDPMQALMREGLLPAVRTDPVVFRAFVRAFNLLLPPDALLSDPDVVGRVLTVFNDRDARPPEPDLGPDRRGLLAALAAA